MRNPDTSSHTPRFICGLRLPNQVVSGGTAIMDSSPFAGILALRRAITSL